MWLDRLVVENFRCHKRLTLQLAGNPWVILSGSNGTGKTSLLEAIYATTRGRSFRRATGPELIHFAADHATVLLDSAGQGGHHLGARYEGSQRTLRLDGAEVKSLAAIGAAIPVDYMGGQAHRLVDESPGARRRFLDWCLFHVEPRFLDVWRRWHRAHRQRNEWLRRGAYPASLGWTEEVIKYGEQVSALRAALVRKLDDHLQASEWAVVGHNRPKLMFKQGWPEGGLGAALRDTADREQRLGRAVMGPQQDDWSLTCGNMRVEQLSRGQTKLVSFYLWNARAHIMREANRTAILLADDFTADLDAQALELAIKALQATAGQVWIVVHEHAPSMNLPGDAIRFHVEPGQAEVC